MITLVWQLNISYYVLCDLELCAARRDTCAKNDSELHYEYMQNINHLKFNFSFENIYQDSLEINNFLSKDMIVGQTTEIIDLA